MTIHLDASDHPHGRGGAPSQSGELPAGGRPERRPARRIVVGVDSRGRSASVVVWAVEEAERGATALTLLSAGHEPHQDEMGDHDLGALARRLTLADIETRRVDGDPARALVDAAAEADLLAVGCRTMRPAQRMLVGSTSLAVACWSPVPVVVVPEPWMQPTLATAPLVAGVRPVDPDLPLSREPDGEVLDFAFARAAALQVPLVVVSAQETPGLDAWSPRDVAHTQEEHQGSLERRLAPWRDAHPTVEVVVRSVAETAHQAIVEASLVCQMVVIGRHHGAALSGALGRTARAVLRHASRPVAVVPAGTREQLVRDLEAQRALRDQPWAPTF
jgi:nucleotide-binding universal stress UspA family protein